MGFNDGMKKVLINVGILIAWLIASIGLALYSRFFNTELTSSIESFHKLAFMYSIPFSLGIIYVSYTLRNKLVFNLLMYFWILNFLIRLFIIILGKSILLEQYGSISINIDLVLFIILFVFAYISKERKLVSIYLGIKLLLIVLTKLRINEYLINSSDFQDYHDGYVILLFGLFQTIVYLISLIILLVIFNQDGIQFYQKNKDITENNNFNREEV